MSDIKIMTPYEAKYGRNFTGRSFFSNEPRSVSAQTKVAELVNDEWIYSRYWPIEGNDWIEKARANIATAMKPALARVRELEEAERILNMIDLTGE